MLCWMVIVKIRFFRHFCGISSRSPSEFFWENEEKNGNLPFCRWFPPWNQLLCGLFGWFGILLASWGEEKRENLIFSHLKTLGKGAGKGGIWGFFQLGTHLRSQGFFEGVGACQKKRKSTFREDQSHKNKRKSQKNLGEIPKTTKI